MSNMRRYCKQLVTLTLLAILFSAFLRIDSRAAAPRAEVPAGAVEVLNAGSFWRWHLTYNQATYKGADGKSTLLKRKKRVKKGDPDFSLVTPQPPADCTKADFDDSTWPRSRMTLARPLMFGRFSTARIVFRGKFMVSDPSAAQLHVSGIHVGGMVIYLNGKEVHRDNMPTGAIQEETEAKPYTDSVYLDDQGKCRRRCLKKPVWARNPVPLKLRRRIMKPFKLPASALRKGLNVLVLDLRRAPYSKVVEKWFNKQPSRAGSPWWPHAEITDFRLSCVGKGAVANVSRPAGLQIWNQDRNDRILLSDFGELGAALRPVSIVGVKNGNFSGHIVLGSDAAISDVKVVPGELKGPGNIPASNLTVLYGRMDWRNRRIGVWSDALQKKPITEVAVSKRYKSAILPLVFKVKIPADAKPGIYKGTVAVKASGKSFDVPLVLEVIDWKVPDPENYRTYMGIYQSPTSVAMQYKVEMWSEKHWQLIEKSLELLSRVGNRMVNIPVVEQTQFGNDRGFVTWIRKADGSYDYDMSVVEKYVKLALKHWKGLDYVTLQIWHAAGGGGKGGWDTRPVDTKCTVTVRDEKTGKFESLQVPPFGTPKSKTFWRPVLAKIQATLKKLGAEKGMCLGIVSDSTAPNAVFELFNEVFPGGKGANWHRGCHVHTDAMKPYQIKSKPKTNLVILHEHCYGMAMVKPDVKPLPALHNFRGRPGTAYFRIVGHAATATLLSNRTMSERALYCQKQGVGRICLDFWNVLKGSRGRGKEIYNRWPHSTCAQRRPSLLYLSWAAADGAGTTMRFEALAEGVQESEAMIVVSEGGASEAKVGAELAGKCRKLMRERIAFCHYANHISEHFTVAHVNHLGWQNLARRAFTLAGEVSRKLGK
jgi:Glycoside hydrolase 123, catalytic domain